MAHPIVEQFVMQRLAENWTHCPVVAMNVIGEAPQDGSPYLLVQYPVSSPGVSDVSLDNSFEIGGVRFVLHMIRGEGLARPQQWAMDLAALFRRVHSGGLKFRDPSSPSYDDDNDEGSFFITSIVVEYRLDY